MVTIRPYCLSVYIFTLSVSVDTFISTAAGFDENYNLQPYCVPVCVYVTVDMHVYSVDLPYNDDDEVQQVPAVSDVGVLVHDQAIGDDLQKRLNSENDEEGIFYCFLHRAKRERRQGWKRRKKHVTLFEKAGDSLSSN